MAIEWTREEIAKLSVDSIESLMLNVKIKGRFDTAALCQVVLEEKIKLAPKSKRKNKASNNPVKVREATICEKLLEVAIDLLDRYDLSGETARRMSRGTKGFRSHKLLSSTKSGIKTGAHQTRDKRVAFDRYISYRLGDYSYALFCILFDENDLSSIRYHVLGDPVNLDKFQSIYKLRPYLRPDEPMGATLGGEEFMTFEEAAERYKWLMSKIAPPLIKP